MVKNSISARSPLSPTLWPREAFLWWRSLGFGVLLFLALIIPSTIFLAVLFVSRVVQLRELQTLTWPVILGQLVGYAFALGVVGLLLPPLAQRTFPQLGLRAPRPGDVGWAIVGAIAMILATAGTGILQEALLHIKPDEVQVHWLREARGSLLVGIVLLACVAAPFFEEIVFRGFLFNAVLRYTPAWVAAIISAFFFGVAHFQPGNAGALAPLAVGGLVLAGIYYRTGSLTASMLTHALFNTATVIGVLVFHQT